jgi:hypothetical protein
VALDGIKEKNLFPVSVSWPKIEWKPVNTMMKGNKLL